jgi:phosphoserine phosphatase RsbU/P
MSTLPELTKEFLRKEFELSAKIIPALEASGDFYDFFYITDNRIAVLIADVAGKGIPAAFYMAMSKILLKSICMQEVDDPSRVIARVNKLLSQDNRSNMFLTAFLFYYDIDSGEIMYANAGHHCSYLLSSKGKVRPFGLLNNMAIGFADNAEYDSESLKLEAGEKVVLYTDGVIEASNPEGVMYGENCFEELLKNNYSFDCQKLSDRIVNEIINYEKNKRFDDITVVVLQKNT